MKEDRHWTQHLPPYTAHVRYDRDRHRFDITLVNERDQQVATGSVRASYMPSFGIDIQDSAEIADEITRMLHRVSGRAEP
ncbi:hypothetical protein I6F26_10365 [Ensifer sp. IC3342]|nr:hypothetical protein [Ensifer sp. BRP08]MCA1446982.1 hypothetical protein [Ensifer sp. IC3342]